MAEAPYWGLRNLDHDPELARALGTLMVAWASAENALIAAFATVTNTDWKMATNAYHHIPTFESRTKVIRAMICEWKDDRYNRKALYRAVLKLNVLARRRNAWVHGFWAATPAAVMPEGASNPKKETVVFNYRAPIGSDNRRKPVTAAGVWSHIANVNKRADEILMQTRVASPDTGA